MTIATLDSKNEKFSETSLCSRFKRVRRTTCSHVLELKIVTVVSLVTDIHVYVQNAAKTDHGKMSLSV